VRAPAPPAAANLIVVEAAVWSGDDPTTAYWAVLVRNPNQDFIGQAPQLNLTFRDAAGRVVGVENDATGGGVIPPGATRLATGLPTDVTGRWRPVTWCRSSGGSTT
jgi:hypothetical protein